MYTKDAFFKEINIEVNDNYERINLNATTVF